MISSLLPFFTLAVAWVVWRVIRPLFVSSPLDNIPGPESASIIKGNLGQLYHRHGGWDFLDALGTKWNKVVKIHGLFGRRQLYVFDPTALQQIVIKETEAYTHPEANLNIMEITLGPNLLAVHGPRHRKQRKMLNPVFSIKHMRSMTPIFYDIAHKLASGLEAEVGNTVTTVNALDWLGRTALELIGQGGLGQSLDTLEKPEPNPLGDAVKEFLPKLFDFSEFQVLTKYIKKMGPAWFRSKLIDILPIQEFRDMKRIVTKMHTESVNILDRKRAALNSGDDALTKAVGEGKDIMSILLRANMTASEEDKLPEDEVLAQMNLLILAGTDTTSNALTVTLEMLGRKADVQDKLRAEIVEAQERYGEDIPYDELVALPYLDALCREILRLFPPPSILAREARMDIMMPLSEPIVGNDGRVMKEIFVPAGTEIILASRAVNRDPTIWGEDAAEFKPERWLSPLPASVLDAHVPGVYANLMTFNGGGRACIGFKFSQLEMKVVLATIVSRFEIALADNADQVVWNFASVRYPTVGKDSNKPEYPIKLERIKA